MSVTLTKYVVWCEEFGESEEDGRLVQAWSARDAVTRDADKSYDVEGWEGAVEWMARPPAGQPMRFLVEPVINPVTFRVEEAE